jgi:hypothetical protein
VNMAAIQLRMNGMTETLSKKWPRNLNIFDKEGGDEVCRVLSDAGCIVLSDAG